MRWLFWRRRSAEQDLDLELRDHWQRQLDDYRTAGIPEDEARRRVALEFGSMELAKDECRDVRRWRWIETLCRDIRVSLRVLHRERLFAAGVVLVLGAGIGATVTMFSVLKGIALRPLPYARPHELVTLSTHRLLQNQFDGTSAANVADWRQQSRLLVDMTLYRRTSASQIVMMSGDTPVRVQEGLVGPEFFELLGAPPLIGRTFSREEFAQGERVVVLSEGLWDTQFGRSREVVHATLSIDGQQHRIVGVMPRSFQLPTAGTRFWRPLSVLGEWWQRAEHERDADSFEVIGRLKLNATLDDAATEMSAIAARLRDAYPEDRTLDVRVASLSDHVIDARLRRGLWFGFAAVLSLLGIACANAGGLLAARAMRRRHELALRAALGARRSRLVMQALGETVSLWSVASACGVLLSLALVPVIVARAPAALPRMDEVGVDLEAILLAIVCALGVVTPCGILPVLMFGRSHADPIHLVRTSAAPPRRRVQQALVISQIAGAMTLLIGAMLLARSFVRVQGEDPGYPANQLLIARIDRPSKPRFFVEARQRLRQLPGVTDVAGITDFFVRRSGDQRVTIEGQQFTGPTGDVPKLVLDSVTPGYFRAMGIDLIEGRDFDERDIESGAASVVIVNRAFARRYFPNETALGRRLVGGTSPPPNDRWATIVGVAGDMRREGLEVAPILSVFVPALLQRMDMTIRTSGRAETMIPAIKAELRTIDPSLPVPSVLKADAQLDEKLGTRRFEMAALVAFAVVAILLSATGLYTSLSYQVTSRRRELGVRATLGAGRPAIVLMFVNYGLRTAALGIILGIAGAASMSRLLRGLLYETPAVDPASYLLAASVVVAVTVISAWQPARRAARVDPIAILREG